MASVKRFYYARCFQPFLRETSGILTAYSEGASVSLSFRPVEAAITPRALFGDWLSLDVS
jgi:hypothetical protein